MTRLGSKRLLWVILYGVLGALAAALAAQHIFHMQPCPWCILQRLICVLLAITCAVGLATDSVHARRVVAATVMLGALSGIGAALWQHFEAAKTDSCMLTLADRIISQYTQLDRWLPSVFAVRASCAQAEVNLLGVPFEFWSLALFLAVFITSARLLVAQAVRA